MAYRIKAKDKSVATALQRIADEQIAAALASIEMEDRPEAIHDVRKRCKKLRGLLRLIRFSFAGYSEENKAFRDIARSISGARDTKVMVDTADALLGAAGSADERRAVMSVRRGFMAQRREALDDDSAAEPLLRARSLLMAASERVNAWDVEADGYAAVSKGLETTYRRARKAAQRARASSDGDAFHELRKRVKYHWHHTRLLENLWPDMMKVRASTAKEASDLLGDHHDLHVLRTAISKEPETFGGGEESDLAQRLAADRQAEIEGRAWPLLDRLLAQSPQEHSAQMEALWSTWRADR